MPDPAHDLEHWRNVVQDAHSWVVAGRYDDAILAFTRALEALGALLGPTDPEVEELIADLEAVKSMRDVRSFGEQLGLRWNDPGVPPIDPDAP